MKRLSAFMLTISLFFSGCATTLNCTVAHAVPYGGVAFDGITMVNGAKGKGPLQFGMGIAAAVDLPLSIVADTVTAPLILTKQIKGKGH